MESQKKRRNIFQLSLICVVLIVVAGTIGFFSRNFIPYEIKTIEPSKFVETTTTEAPKTTVSIEQQFDVLGHTLGAAIGIIQEAPKFVFSFGSKLLSVMNEGNDADNPESNVFSVAGRKNSS